MKIPRPVVLAGRRCATRRAGRRRVWRALAGCQEEQSPGVFLEFRAENDQFRPEAIRFTWMRAGAELVNARLPEDGSLHQHRPGAGFDLHRDRRPAGGAAAAGGQGHARGHRGASPASWSRARWRWCPPRTIRCSAGRSGWRSRWPTRTATAGPTWSSATACARAGAPAWRRLGPSPGGPPDGGGGAASRSPTAERRPIRQRRPTPARSRWTSGLIGYWRLDEGSGTLARDSSGQGNNGTLARAARTAPGCRARTGPRWRSPAPRAAVCSSRRR